jgi:hypothetical protein
MKKIIIACLAAFLSFNVIAQDSGIGIGALIGTTVDFTAKFWMSEKTAFVASTGFDYGGAWGGWHVTADFLIHNWSFDVAEDMMKVYFGPGIGLGVYLGSWYSWYDHSRVWITPRAPGGVGYYFHSIPLEAFAEFAPGFDIIGPYGFNFRWDSYVGARWYF